MPRWHHPDHDIRSQLRRMERAGGWRVEHPVGHWGRVVCAGDATGDRCVLAVSGTPRNAGMLRRLRERAQRCPHGHAVAR